MNRSVRREILLFQSATDFFYILHLLKFSFNPIIKIHF